MTNEPPASADTPPGRFDLAAWLRWWAWRAPALFVVLTIVGAALRYLGPGGEAGDLGGSLRGAALFAAIFVPTWLIGGELFDAPWAGRHRRP
jgi:hypothetical protein